MLALGRQRVNEPYIDWIYEVPLSLNILSTQTMFRKNSRQSFGNMKWRSVHKMFNLFSVILCQRFGSCQSAFFIFFYWPIKMGGLGNNNFIYILFIWEKWNCCYTGFRPLIFFHLGYQWHTRKM